MTEKELKKFKQKDPTETLAKFKIEFVKDRKEDEYGIYETGYFKYKGMQILVNVEDGLWHLSVAADYPLGYMQIKDVRYKFMPDDMQVAQIFPSRKEYVNVHESCYHLWQLRSINEIDPSKQ